MHIAIDIGGTHIRVAAFRGLEASIPETVDIFNTQNDYGADIGHLKEAIHRLDNGPFQGIGLGIPAILDQTRSRVIRYVNLSHWDGRPLLDDLKQEFQCPVLFENDAMTAALGEAFYGHGQGKSFLHLTWGTGVGGAMVEWHEGKAHSIPFEPGHQILDWNEKEPCHCGQRGCLEFFCGGGELLKRLGEPPAKLSGVAWSAVVERLAQGIVNLIAIRPVTLVVLGGGIPRGRPESLSEIQRIVQDRLRIFPCPEIRFSALGDQGGVLGALALFRL